ncbi:PilT/PilU family type 4a pilus ATPase [Euzebya tangerina]|uniref:PilT/PilU family type 4a pilus ATPase n=1 Tax=Euzebya tangerina TaxID=591198 RepID=UPI000E31164E|nr:PilT/PilU family type 4a pilus ATPase [Euzebya tangerina]
MSQLQQPSAPPAPAAPSTPSLGDILIEQGVLSPERLQQAQAVQSMNNTSLGKTLVEMQMASEEQIVSAVAVQIGVPFAEVRPGTVDPTAASLLPRDVARELVALPVRFTDDNSSLLVALADPGNSGALEQISAITSMPTAPALAVRANLMQAIEHLADASAEGTVSLPVTGGGTDDPSAGSATPDNVTSLPERRPGAGGSDEEPNTGLMTRDRALLDELVAEAGANDEPALPAGRMEPLPTQERAPAAMPSRPQPVTDGGDPKLAYEVESEFDMDAALLELIERGGSDLHLTVGIPPAIRVNGELEHLKQQPLEGEGLRNALYGLMTQKQREAFENELELDMSYTLPGHSRFRVNIFQQRESIGAVMRVIPFEILPLEDLGVPAQVSNFAFAPRGMVLVTGPTGSGKSTTLASVIDIINRERASHIMTVEDPIEFLHTHKKSVVNQRELGQDTHSFNNALKHVLRQDPDVILVGELRDLETIQLAITAAETGHLVFGTLHTQDAPQTIDRIIDVFPPHQQEQIRVMLATALNGVVTQQLLKKADGSGRVVATEIMVATSAIKNLIREGKTHQMYSSIQAGKQHGMIAMDQSLADLVNKGKVTYNHALERCANVNDFNRLCGRG